MGLSNKWIAVLAVPALLWTSPAGAQSAHGEAEQLRRLDIMLMVTALRCRFGEDDFQSDYNRFAARHLETMNGAAQQLQAEYAARGGSQQARRALDQLSTGMANRYGQGHPWLGCAQLRSVAQGLSEASGREVLLAAAADLLEDIAPGRETLLARYGE